MVLRTKKDGKGFYLGCKGYPSCNNAIWFPSSIKQATVTDEYCENVIFQIEFFFNFSKIKHLSVDQKR